MELRRNWPGVVILALAAMPLIGCGGGDTGKPNGDAKIPPAKTTHYESPQAVFDASKEALQKKDYEKFADLMTDEARDVFAGMMVMTGSMVKAMSAPPPIKFDDPELKKLQAAVDAKIKPLNEVFAKHKITDANFKKVMATMKEFDPAKKPKPAEVKKTLASLGQMVQDKGAFIADMLTTINVLMDKKDDAGPFGKVEDAKLIDLKEDGDKATATLVKSDGTKEPMVFEKTAQGWRIGVSDENIQQMMSNMAGGPGEPEGPELPPLPPPGKDD